MTTSLQRDNKNPEHIINTFDQFKYAPWAILVLTLGFAFGALIFLKAIVGLAIFSVGVLAFFMLRNYADHFISKYRIYFSINSVRAPKYVARFARGEIPYDTILIDEIDYKKTLNEFSNLCIREQFFDLYSMDGRSVRIDYGYVPNKIKKVMESRLGITMPRSALASPRRISE